VGGVGGWGGWSQSPRRHVTPYVQVQQCSVLGVHENAPSMGTCVLCLVPQLILLAMFEAKPNEVEKDQLAPVLTDFNTE